MRMLSLAGLGMLAACTVVPPSAPPPVPPPPPAPPPPPPPPPVVIEPERPWDVASLTPGDWRYETGAALFTDPAGRRVAVLRCDRATRQVMLSISGSSPAPSPAVTIRTTSGTLAWSGVAGTPGNPSVEITRPARDAGFDWIAYSRGRIAIEVQGMARLILPVWAEVSRVIEDCRG
jgi:hypothetical protein